MIDEIRSKVKSILELFEKREPKLRGGFPQRPFIIAIDGRCGAGKTTLASALKNAIERRVPKPIVRIIHMDEFYPRTEQRTEQRYKTPGGNIDYERFDVEVIDKLLTNKTFSYRPFDCTSMELSEPVFIDASHVVIIEGSYCLHPELRDNYDLKVFLDISPKKQRERILARNGEEKLIQFTERWIPMEELYFDNCGVRECADILL